MTIELDEKALEAADKEYFIALARRVNHSIGHEDHQRAFHAAITAYLTAASAKGEEGWKIVPVEPTKKMCPREQDEQSYRAALAASPSPERGG